MDCGFLKKSLIMNAPLVGCPFPVSPASKFAIIEEITSVHKLNHIVFFLKLRVSIVNVEKNRRMHVKSLKV